MHAIIVYQVHYRESPTDEFKIIDDLITVRQMLDDIQRPFITPENVLFAPTEEGGELNLLFIRFCAQSATRIGIGRHLALSSARKRQRSGR